MNISVFGFERKSTFKDMCISQSKRIRLCRKHSL